MMKDNFVYVICTWQPWPLGKLASLVGMHWSHAFLLMGQTVYESTARGVWKHPYQAENKGEHHQAYRVYRPLTALEEATIFGAAEGMCGKFYNYLMYPSFIWRILRDLLGLHITRALSRPAEVCSTFVQETFRIAGIDLVPGKPALPDDLANSPLLQATDSPLEVEHG